MGDVLQPSEDELRRAWALILADALQWTKDPTAMQLGVIREGAMRLVRSDPLSVDEEGEFQRALLEAGCHLTGPFSGRLLGLLDEARPVA